MLPLHNILAVLGTASVLGAQWYWRTLHLDAEAALKSFSPELVAVLTNHPDWFTQDFPGGAAEMLKALPYTIYPPVHALGFSMTEAWAGMIALEMVLLAAAAAYATRAFFPQSSVVARALAAIFVSSSSMLQPDLANFSFPYYGWVYGFTLAAFLFAIADTAARRLVPASCWLVIAYACHPINGLFSAAFMAAMVLSTFGSWRWRDFALPAVIAAVGCGSWTAYVAASGTLGGGGIDPELFAVLNRGLNVHWYPVFVGLYWDYGFKNFVPFLSTLALGALALGPHSGVEPAKRRQAAAGIVAMLAIAAAGVLISLLLDYPALIKLALHRAGTNAVAASAIFIIHLIYRDFTTGDRIERSLAAVLALVPFLYPTGLMAGPVLARVAYASLPDVKASSRDSATMAAVLVAAGIVVLVVVYAAAGLVTRQVLLDQLRWIVVLAAALGLTALRPVGFAPAFGRWALLALATVASVATSSTHLRGPITDDEMLSTAYGYLEAQRWAKSNTPPGTLFMVDPTIGYGWRDKSHRPSFGSLREWLLVSVMYNSRPELLEEGMARFKALGADPSPILWDTTATRMRTILIKINKVARERYYAMEPGLYRQLAATYGIRFFVFEKKHIQTPPPLATAFENKHFLIAKAP